MSMSQSKARASVDPVLTTVAHGYTQPGLVGHALFPRVEVEARGGRVVKFGKEAMQLAESERAPGATIKRVGVGFESGSYALVEYDLEGVVPFSHLEDASVVPGVDLGEVAAMTMWGKILLDLEVKQAALATNAANYGADNKITLSGSSKWSHADSKPGAQIRTGSEAIRRATGLRPNTLVVGPLAWAALVENPAILDRTKYTSKDSLTPAILAAMWNLDKVEVADAVVADDAGTLTDVWGDFAILAHVAQPMASGGKLTRGQASYGYTYTLKGKPVVEAAYADKRIKSWVYPVSNEAQPLLTGMGAGYLFTDCA